MKVLVTEKALRSAVRRLLREADEGRLSDTSFLRSATGADALAAKDDVMRLLNLAYFTGTGEFSDMEDWKGYESVPIQKFAANGARADLGITYDTAVSRLEKGTLTGVDIEPIWQAFMQEVLGLGLTSMSGRQVNFTWEDFAGSINAYFEALNYPKNLKSLGVFTYRVLNEPDFANDYVSSEVPYAGTKPIEDLKPDQLAVLKDPAKAQTFITRSGADPTSIEGAETAEVLKYDVLQSMVTGMRVESLQESAKELSFIKSTLSDLAKNVLTIKGATEQSGRSLARLFTMETYTPTELESVADSLLYTYTHPATISLTAVRPPEFSCFAVVDTANKLIEDEDLSEYAVFSVVGGLALGYLATVALPQWRGFAPGRYFSSENKQLGQLERSLDDARSKFSDLANTDAYKRLDGLKKQINDIKDEEKALGSVQTAAASALGRGKFSGITGARRAAGELDEYEAAIEELRSEYTRLFDLAKERRTQYDAELTRLRAAYDASKKELQGASPSPVLTPGSTARSRTSTTEREILDNMSSADRAAYDAHLGTTPTVRPPDMPTLDTTAVAKPSDVTSGGMNLRTLKSEVEKAKEQLKQYDDALEALSVKGIERTSRQGTLSDLEVPAGYTADRSVKLEQFVETMETKVTKLNTSVDDMKKQIARALEYPEMQGTGIKEKLLEFMSKSTAKFFSEGAAAVGITTAFYYAVIDLFVAYRQQAAGWIASLSEIEKMLLVSLKYAFSRRSVADHETQVTDWSITSTNHVKDVALAFAEGVEVTKSLYTTAENKELYEALARSIAAFAEKSVTAAGTTQTDYADLLTKRKAIKPTATSPGAKP